MMNAFQFSDTAHIYTQGQQVLILQHRGPQFVKYNLVGFHRVVTIKDYRLNGLKAIDHFLTTHDTEHFPHQFNAPAFLRMNVINSSDIQIELFDTDDSNPKYRLWLVTNLHNMVPVYRYLYKQIQPMDNHHFAFLSLYQLTPAHHPRPLLRRKSDQVDSACSSLVVSCEA